MQKGVDRMKTAEPKLWLVKRHPSVALAGGGGCWVSDVVCTVALVSSVLRHDDRMVSFGQPLSDVGDL